MSLRSLARAALDRHSALNVAFRRHVWSRIHFPEAEMAWLHNLSGRPFDVAVDVGAALGGYAWLLDRVARRVIAFEPGQDHAEFLALGLGGTRIELERKAVGAADGSLPMYTPGDDTDARHSATLSADNPVVAAQATHVREVPVVALDGFLAQKLAPGERLDFLKVDVEGFENAVFEGARARLATDHPLVLCEIEARHNARYGEAFALLRGQGYATYVSRGGRFERFDGEDIAPLQRAEDLAFRLSAAYRPGTSRYINNFLFVHPQSKFQLP